MEREPRTILARRATVTGLLVALAGVAGCAPLYHLTHYQYPFAALENRHRSYYHSPQTGKIIPKPGCQPFAEPPCFGYESTCWQRWPEYCPACPVAGDMVLYEHTSGDPVPAEAMPEPLGVEPDASNTPPSGAESGSGQSEESRTWPAPDASNVQDDLPSDDASSGAPNERRASEANGATSSRRNARQPFPMPLIGVEPEALVPLAPPVQESSRVPNGAQIPESRKARRATARSRSAGPRDSAASRDPFAGALPAAEADQPRGISLADPFLGTVSASSEASASGPVAVSTQSAAGLRSGPGDIESTVTVPDAAPSGVAVPVTRGPIEHLTASEPELAGGQPGGLGGTGAGTGGGMIRFAEPPADPAGSTHPADGDSGLRFRE
jgi:hypothetical protein